MPNQENFETKPTITTTVENKREGKETLNYDKIKSSLSRYQSNFSGNGKQN